MKEPSIYVLKSLRKVSLMNNKTLRDTQYLSPVIFDDSFFKWKSGSDSVEGLAMIFLE